MNEGDAFIVITGHLKIFDFINVDENIKNKIEFIDLPGHDRKNNTFNYYSKILKFSNCRIYINDPKTIDDEKSVARLLDQYTSDRDKISSSLRTKFNTTCLFLINKADTLESEMDRSKIKNNIYKNIKSVEKNISQDILNISFVSGEKLNYFLKLYYKYVDLLDKNKFVEFIYLLYKEYEKKWFNFDFYSFLSKEIEKIKEDLDIDLEEEDEEVKVPDVPQIFIKEILNSFNFIFTKIYNIRDSKKEKKLATKFYKLKYLIQNKQFNDTNYSREFLYKIKDIIINSEQIQNDNFKLFSDQLLKREISQEIAGLKINRKTRSELLKILNYRKY